MYMYINVSENARMRVPFQYLSAHVPMGSNLYILCLYAVCIPSYSMSSYVCRLYPCTPYTVSSYLCILVPVTLHGWMYHKWLSNPVSVFVYLCSSVSDSLYSCICISGPVSLSLYLYLYCIWLWMFVSVRLCISLELCLYFVFLYLCGCIPVSLYICVLNGWPRCAWSDWCSIVGQLGNDEHGTGGGLYYTSIPK